MERITREVDPVVKIFGKSEKKHRFSKSVVWYENLTGRTSDVYLSQRGIVCDRNTTKCLIGFFDQK